MRLSAIVTGFNTISSMWENRSTIGPVIKDDIQKLKAARHTPLYIDTILRRGSDKRDWRVLASTQSWTFPYKNR